ncbi:hypothetical protein [Asaia sp. As-1742]|uniref:glycine-rich domain-containing protein n=1 Tax=Asaia sp. As-1742 TaxID=2608325 RepID=UPI0014220EE0|nr:hypothetical protein [Asaia sp. As-1742]NIE79254.1 hypothetical protein [Asaia sp. As-1742]
MDRPIIYSGSVPFDTDLLRLGRYAKEGVGRLAEILLGSQTVMASGLACVVSSSDLSVSVEPGTIIAPYALDGSHIGSVSAGLAAAPAIVPSLFYNDEVQHIPVSLTGATLTLFAICSEQDDSLDVLPFYNADQPDQTMAGPDNRGKALPTRRTGRITFVMASDPPAVAGAVVVPLYDVTIPAGAQTLSGVVAQPGAAFMPHLTQFATMDFAQQVSQPHAVCATSGLLTIPDWAKHVELRLIGAGGGGASCSVISPDAGAFSGAGGGAGGDAWGIYALDPARDSTLSVTIGLGGGPDQKGGPSYVTYGGQPLLSADGGEAGYFSAARNSCGGSGGGAAGGILWNQYGGAGSDGQFGNLVFAGNGADGPWGGGGKAGALLGLTATKYGAGGGGAYMARQAGEVTAGGRGFQGCLIYRFLY